MDSVFPVFTTSHPILAGDNRACQFAPYNTAYEGLDQHLAAAGLPGSSPPAVNYWNSPVDVNTMFLPAFSSNGGAISHAGGAVSPPRDRIISAHLTSPLQSPGAMGADGGAGGGGGNSAAHGAVGGRDELSPVMLPPQHFYSIVVPVTKSVLNGHGGGAAEAGGAAGGYGAAGGGGEGMAPPTPPPGASPGVRPMDTGVTPPGAGEGGRPNFTADSAGAGGEPRAGGAAAGADSGSGGSGGLYETDGQGRRVLRNPFALPSEYAQVLAERRATVHKLQASVQDSGLDAAGKQEVEGALKAYFADWLVTSGNLRQVLDLVNLDREAANQAAGGAASGAGAAAARAGGPNASASTVESKSSGAGGEDEGDAMRTSSS